MKDDTARWLGYADENLNSATLLLEHGLFNTYLQNVQQAVEKYLKAALLETDVPVKKTHNINELTNMLKGAGIDVHLTADECDLLDSIYLPSKYPLGSALPDFEPDYEICERCISFVHQVKVKANVRGSVL